MNERNVMRTKYLDLLAREYPTIVAAQSEIINLKAIMGLPKGTEYFFSDMHGEYESFLNLLRSASGTIRNKIRILFGDTLTEGEQERFAQLVYYPENYFNENRDRRTCDKEWQKITIFRLVKLCREMASKYTRSKVRKKLPEDYAYAMDELLNVDTSDKDKKKYYKEIINSIVETRAGATFIEELCVLAQQLAVDKLHIIGDIFDRGPRADIIMNELTQFPDVDIQWGNHDISWMGAACGNEALIANVVRIAVSYNNFDVLEDGYGINLRPLSMFASDVYGEDPCAFFMPKLLDENKFDHVDAALAAKMHKAIAVIQFKLEGQIIKRHPEYDMEERSLLEKIDPEKMTVTVEGKEYAMRDVSFPTVDRKNPWKLTRGEQELLDTLKASFRHCEMLHRHVNFLYSHGGMYLCYNSNLLYHGCIPMEEDASFSEFLIDGQAYRGRKLLDVLQKQMRDAYFLTDGKKKRQAADLAWYLWCGKKSPLFGKSKMAAFEGYFIDDGAAKKEVYNPYYRLSQKPEVCCKILEEFSLDPERSHIINGHVPVRIKNGESPIKAEGKLYVIDGGISKAYRTKTGIAGYTLIYNSHHIALAEHAIVEEEEKKVHISPEMKVTEWMPERVLVGDTDIGKKLEEKIADLTELIRAYEEGRY